MCEIVVKRLYSRKFQIGGMIHTKDPKIVFILTWIDEDRIEFRLLFSQPTKSYICTMAKFVRFVSFQQLKIIAETFMEILMSVISNRIKCVM